MKGQTAICPYKKSRKEKEDDEQGRDLKTGKG